MGGEWDIVIIKCLMYHHNMQQEPDGIHTRNQAFEATQLTLKLIQEGRNCGDFLSLVSHITLQKILNLKIFSSF
jgi:hypothetical protein